MLQGALEGQGGSIELRNLVLEGTKITFTVERETPRGTFELTYTGEVDGNTMAGTLEGPGGGASRSTGRPPERRTDRLG